MVVMILPEFVTELEEKLDEVIKDISAKNHIDLLAVEDSKSIEKGKALISYALVRLYENYNVEDRKRLEEFEKEMKKFGGCGKELSKSPDILICGQDTDLHGRILYCNSCKKKMKQERKKKQKWSLTKKQRKRIGRGMRKSWVKREGKSKKKIKKRRYPKEMESFVRSNANIATNKELVELVEDKFGIKTTAPRLSNYMTMRGIRRK